MISDACCPMAYQLVRYAYVPMASDLYNYDVQAMYTGLNWDGK